MIIHVVVTSLAGVCDNACGCYVVGGCLITHEIVTSLAGVCDNTRDCYVTGGYL